MEPYLRGHPEERPTSLDRSIRDANLYIKLLIFIYISMYSEATNEINTGTETKCY